MSRQTVHVWLRRYAAEGGAVNLEDRSSRPNGCPHQMPAVVEVRVLEVRDAHPYWGRDRVRYQLERDGVVVGTSWSAIYRALDVVGGIHLAGGAEVKAVTGIDDNSRFVVSSKVVARATARAGV